MAEPNDRALGPTVSEGIRAAWTRFSPSEPNSVYGDHFCLVATTWNGADRGSIALCHPSIVESRDSFSSLTHRFGAVNPATL